MKEYEILALVSVYEIRSFVSPAVENCRNQKGRESNTISSKGIKEPFSIPFAKGLFKVSALDT